MYLKFLRCGSTFISDDLFSKRTYPKKHGGPGCGRPKIVHGAGVGWLSFTVEKLGSDGVVAS